MIRTMIRAITKSLLSLLFISFANAQISIPFPGPGTVSSSGGGFTNTRSIITNDNVKSLSRTQGTGSSLQKMTFSFWFRSNDTANTNFILSLANSIDLIGVSSGKASVILNSGGDGLINSTLTFSNNIWYHVVVQLDTSNVTSGNRCKIFIDAVDTTNIIIPATLNYNTNWGNNGTNELNVFENSGVSSDLIDEVSKIDNQVLAPSSFATSNLPINISALIFGLQGYWLRFETGIGATLGVDSSGNSLTFTSTYDNADSSTTVP